MASAFRWLEGRRVAGKWLDNFHMWIDGTTVRPSGGGSSSSPALWSGRSGARERNWAGWGAPVGHGGALGVLDREWEVAAAAVDGEPRPRRRSGEVESSGEEMIVEM
jgi:hypothetical protein